MEARSRATRAAPIRPVPIQPTRCGYLSSAIVGALLSPLRRCENEGPTSPHAIVCIIGTLRLPRKQEQGRGVQVELISGLTYISRACNNRSMHAFDVLGDPVRRRILEMLAEGEHTVGRDHLGHPERVRHLPAGGVTTSASPPGWRLRLRPGRRHPPSVHGRLHGIAGSRHVAETFPASVGPAPRCPGDRAGTRQAGASCRAGNTRGPTVNEEPPERGTSMIDISNQIEAIEREVSRRQGRRRRGGRGPDPTNAMTPRTRTSGTP